MKRWREQRHETVTRDRESVSFVKHGSFTSCKGEDRNKYRGTGDYRSYWKRTGRKTVSMRTGNEL